MPKGWVTMPEYFRRNGYTVLGTGKIFHWGPGVGWTSSLEHWTAPGSVTSGIPGLGLSVKAMEKMAGKYHKEVLAPKPEKDAAQGLVEQVRCHFTSSACFLHPMVFRNLPLTLLSFLFPL